MIRRAWLAASCIVAASVAAAISFAAPQLDFGAGQAMVLPVDPDPLLVETDQGARSFSIEVADEVGERTRGLMFRETMADDHGMLFVFEQQKEVGFWMKDTPMPLDLIFIGQDGVIRDIERGEPFSEATVAPDEPVRFVLELKAGTAERAGIEDGDKVRHRVIDTASMPGNPG